MAPLSSILASRSSPRSPALLLSALLLLSLTVSSLASSSSPSFASSSNATSSDSRILSSWHFCGDRARAVGLERGSAEYLALFRAEAQCFNDLVLFFLPTRARARAPHLLLTWLRNYVAGIAVYFLSSGTIAFFLYKSHFKVFQNASNSQKSRGSAKAGGAASADVDSEVASSEAIWKQIKVSMAGMPLYSLLPTLSERMVELGWTRCYAQKEEIGLVGYWAYLALYLLFVEFGVYWMHRGLHDVKPLYRALHATHHIYNKHNTLSPFAGLAFHPLDGILQASPHVAALLIFPTHFFTHEVLLFLEGVWTAVIHDNVDERIFPIMGAKYHTIHHTTYRHNYGHYTVLMDWLFGTLREPEGRRPKPAAKAL